MRTRALRRLDGMDRDWTRATDRVPLSGEEVPAEMRSEGCVILQPQLDRSGSGWRRSNSCWGGRPGNAATDRAEPDAAVPALQPSLQRPRPGPRAGQAPVDAGLADDCQQPGAGTRAMARQALLQAPGVAQVVAGVPIRMGKVEEIDGAGRHRCRRICAAHAAWARVGVNKPRSRRLTCLRCPPMTTWSRTSTPSRAPTRAASTVNATSSGEGVGSPDG